MGTRHLIKHSVSLKGHRTSIALEGPYWEALEALAEKRGQSLTALIIAADIVRDTPLTSFLRLMALESARSGDIPAA